MTIDAQLGWLGCSQVLVCVCPCELVQIVGMFSFLFILFFTFWLKAVARELLVAALTTFQSSFIRWRPGLERELNIYPLHVKIILKIENRCRTAVCRTCTRMAGAVAARACVRLRDT